MYRLASARPALARLYGARTRLPAALDGRGYTRLAATLGLELEYGSGPHPDNASVEGATDVADTAGVRFASLEDVETAGFQRIGCGLYVASPAQPPGPGQGPGPGPGPGPAVPARSEAEADLHRFAHAIWELRCAPDGDGYVLVRKREERAVDLRTAGAERGILNVNLAVPIDADTALGMLRGKPGGTAENQTEAEEHRVAPLERDPFETAVPASDAERELEDDAEHVASLYRQAQLVEAIKLRDAEGRWVTVQRSFRPELHGGGFIVRGMDWPASPLRELARKQRIPSDGPAFYVEGWHRPGDTDAVYGVPHPVLPYPSARPEHFDLNARIRAFPAGGGPPVFLTVRELDLFVGPGRDQSIPSSQTQYAPLAFDRPLEEPLDMPGEALSPGELPTVDEYGSADTSIADTSLKPRGATHAACAARNVLYEGHEHEHEHELRAPVRRPDPSNACAAPDAAPGRLVRDGNLPADWQAHRDRDDSPDRARPDGVVPGGYPSPDPDVSRTRPAACGAAWTTSRNDPRVPRG